MQTLLQYTQPNAGVWGVHCWCPCATLRAMHPFFAFLCRLQDELEAEKLIKNRLPQLTANLSKSIPQWENAQQAVFLYKGERYGNPQTEF